MKYKPFGDNIVIRVFKRSTGIVIPDVKSGSSQTKFDVEKTEIWAVGDEVKNLKAGQRVVIDSAIFGRPGNVLLMHKILKTKEDENVMYLRAKESDILGIIED